jgi:hypothetical protein
VSVAAPQRCSATARRHENKDAGYLTASAVFLAASFVALAVLSAAFSVPLAGLLGVLAEVLYAGDNVLCEDGRSVTVSIIRLLAGLDRELGFVSLCRITPYP